MSLDELRQRFPHLGFAIYALEPGRAVTLEVHDRDEVYTFVGRTAAEAIFAAFPTEPEQPALPKPANVFD